MRLFTKRNFLALLVIALALIIGRAAAHYFANTAPFRAELAEGFESGSLEKIDPRFHPESCCEYSAKIVPSPQGTGNSVRFSLASDDPNVKGSKRSELRLPAGRFETETWYRLRTYFPQEWTDVQLPVTVFQWHGVPDKILFEGNRPPPLRLLYLQGTWHIPLNWDQAALSFRNSTILGERQGQILWSGPAELGKWDDWVFKVVWSHGDTGRVVIWKNGAQIANYKGPTAYNDLVAPYLKAGIYLPVWAKGQAPKERETMVAFFDDIWEVYPDTGNGTLSKEVIEFFDQYSNDDTVVMNSEKP